MLYIILIFKIDSWNPKATFDLLRIIYKPVVLICFGKKKFLIF